MNVMMIVSRVNFDRYIVLQRGVKNYIHSCFCNLLKQRQWLNTTLFSNIISLLIDTLLPVVHMLGYSIKEEGFADGHTAIYTLLHALLCL